MFQHPQHGVTMSNTILWKVGSGDKFKFWEDTRLGGEDTLLQRYPRLYIISSQQNQIIQQIGAFRDTEWEWDLWWRRPLFDSEMGMAVSFLTELERFRIQPHSDDQWVWKAEPSGQYTAKSAYSVPWGEVSSEHQDGAFKELWNLKLPPKIVIFAWRLIRDRLPTKSNLRRRHIEIDDSTCPFCRSVEETAAHLFFHCSKITPLWWESLSWVNIMGAFPKSPKATLSPTYTWSDSRHEVSQMEMVVGCIDMDHLEAKE